jgi:ferredoxin
VTPLGPTPRDGMAEPPGLGLALGRGLLYDSGRMMCGQEPAAPEWAAYQSPQATKGEFPMKVTISDACTGCGVCETIAPDVFQVEDDRAKVNEGEIKGNEAAIKEAAQECPDEAIKVAE